MSHSGYGYIPASAMNWIVGSDNYCVACVPIDYCRIPSARSGSCRCIDNNTGSSVIDYYGNILKDFSSSIEFIDSSIYSERYRYREDLFPSVTFRRAYDALCVPRESWKADIEYVRLLHLAASTMEQDVEQALTLLLEAGADPTADQVRQLVSPEPSEVPELVAGAVDLAEYDELLDQTKVVS